MEGGDIPLAYLQFVIHCIENKLTWWRIEPKNSAAFHQGRRQKNFQGRANGKNTEK